MRRGGVQIRRRRSAHDQRECAGGSQADVTIRNTGSSAVNGWNLKWTFANGQQISQGGTPTSHRAVARPPRQASRNGSIAPGGSAAFGFLVTTAGSTNGKPAGFTLNGAVCDTA
ncbi:cellulose binding domain-containing protein [Microbispora sp. NPDC088329]|uniref:cellulose binding domain-containing protein n=1 Tax=Microbispora sp. NPDC088329 TaxID=3154869 RepID=UPI0034152D3E